MDYTRVFVYFQSAIDYFIALCWLNDLNWKNSCSLLYNQIFIVLSNTTSFLSASNKSECIPQFRIVLSVVCWSCVNMSAKHVVHGTWLLLSVINLAKLYHALWPPVNPHTYVSPPPLSKLLISCTDECSLLKCHLQFIAFIFRCLDCAFMRSSLMTLQFHRMPRRGHAIFWMAAKAPRWDRTLTRPVINMSLTHHTKMLIVTVFRNWGHQTTLRGIHSTTRWHSIRLAEHYPFSWRIRQY